MLINTVSDKLINTVSFRKHNMSSTNIWVIGYESSLSWHSYSHLTCFTSPINHFHFKIPFFIRSRANEISLVYSNPFLTFFVVLSTATGTILHTIPIIRALSTVQVNYHSDAKLVCNVTGYPVPSITWKYNNVSTIWNYTWPIHICFHT